MSEALRIIWERDGFRGLRRGMSPRVLTFAPSTAISWLSYEFFSASGERWTEGVCWADPLCPNLAEVMIREYDVLPKTGSMA